MRRWAQINQIKVPFEIKDDLHFRLLKWIAVRFFDIEHVHLEVKRYMVLAMHLVQSRSWIETIISPEISSYKLHSNRFIAWQASYYIKSFNMDVAEGLEPDNVLEPLYQRSVAKGPFWDAVFPSDWDMSNDPDDFTWCLCLL